MTLDRVIRVLERMRARQTKPDVTITARSHEPSKVRIKRRRKKRRTRLR